MPKICKTARYNRFQKSKIQKNTYDEFSFSKSLKSYKDEELFFTNFVKTKNNECYQKIERYLDQCSLGDYNFLEDEFLPLDEIYYTEPSGKRLLAIINKGYHHHFKPDDLKNIFEIKHKMKKGFHFFLYVKGNKIEVLMIDFFHLGIEAYLWINGKPKKMHKEDIYHKECNNDWDLNNLVK